MNFKTDIDYRKEKLSLLLKNILKYEDEVIACLHKDFKKPPVESFLTETSFITSELKHTLKNCSSWANPKQVLPALLNFPSTDVIYSEPYGKVLIIGPFNYPFQLSIGPLIGAVAAGNSVTLKPSELTPNTSSIISKIIRETFEINHVVAILGDVLIAQELLKKRWDYIFFTGSVAVGKIIAKSAAENLTPTTLELGGKSPCIIDETANLKLAAKRIVWGKMLNAGQTCVAIDYILVHEKSKEKLVDFLKIEIEKTYGKNPELSPDFARIISPSHWLRLHNMLENQTLLHGGQSNRPNLYIAPTLIDEPSLTSKVMNEEIFGPILPILSYKNNEEIKAIVSRYEKPLSFYVFSTNKKNSEALLKTFSFGGGCVNDSLIQLYNKRLPFGGVGQSGIGAYHGKLSFDIFSHKKPIVFKGNWYDLPFRYAPYKNKLQFLKKILSWL